MSDCSYAVECRRCGEVFDCCWEPFVYCDTCFDLLGDEAVEIECHAARFRAAMVAMSRFMTWVWMEAEYQEDGGQDCGRRVFLSYAIESGRLALRWSDE